MYKKVKYRQNFKEKLMTLDSMRILPNIIYKDGEEINF